MTGANAVAAVTMSREDAERLTSRIKLMAGTIADNVEKFFDLIEQAKESGTHEILGFPSWPAYFREAVGDAPLRLERVARREVVAGLSALGMSTREIAPFVGVNNATVHRDLKPVANATPPGIVDSDEIVETAAQYTQDVWLNGKKYPRVPDRARFRGRIDPLYTLGQIVLRVEGSGVVIDEVTYDDVSPELAADMLRRIDAGQKSIGRLRRSLLKIASAEEES